MLNASFLARFLSAASDHVAAVDMGTNSFHMIIAHINEQGSFRVIDRLKHWVRLGDGIDKRGRLDEAAIERMSDSLRQFKQLADSYNASLHCIATSAMRDAANRDAIIARIFGELGLRIEVISGQEEARLVFQGVRSEGHIGEEPACVIDIGGGSIEVMIGHANGLLAAESLDMGARRYARQFFDSGKYKSRDLDACIHAASSKIQSVTSAFAAWPAPKAIGTSGTIRALARLAVNWEQSENPDRLKLTTLEQMLPQLIDAVRDRDSLEGIENERRDTLVAGAIILMEVMTALSLDELEVCQSALREGIVFDRVESHGRVPQQPMRASVEALVRRFSLDTAQIERVMATADLLFEAYAEQLGLDEESYELLHAAVQLHEIGLCITHKRMHLHGAYMVAHADMTGISFRQQQMLAALIRFHRKGKPGSDHPMLTGMHERDMATIKSLAAILRLAAALNRTKSGEAALPDIELRDDGWHWLFNDGWHAAHEVCIWNGEQEKKVLAKLLGSAISLDSKGHTGDQ
jgi:exopolyphosphatase/guanosine-5'-triphosphate,3'-diphosphate pyrophosphatase